LSGNLDESLDLMNRSSMLRVKMGNLIIDTLCELASKNEVCDFPSSIYGDPMVCYPLTNIQI